MKISLDEMQQINKIQADIFRHFIDVCDKLNLTYYMVHGSLLGALRFKGFFPFDDDIDVAMPRRDYDRLISDGQKFLPKQLFIQSCETEEKFPLPFAKIRNSNTAFIQPLLKKCSVNMGIYIDVFPIDYFPENKGRQKKLKLKEKLLTYKINSKLVDKTNCGFKKRFFYFFISIFAGSLTKNIKKRADLYKKTGKSSEIIVVGAKDKEKGIPARWFKGSKTLWFEGIQVKCPACYDEYLTKIYGDYNSYDPSKKYKYSPDLVEISADVYSTTQSYKDLI